MKKLLITLLLLSNLILARDQTEMKKPDGYSSKFMLKVAYFFGFLDLVERHPEVPATLAEYKDLVYKSIDSLALKVDVYHQKAIQRKAPLLIFIHGGAWKSGKKEDYLPYLIPFAEQGYVTATVQYRLSRVAQYPAAVQDVSCAVRWLKDNADHYFIDTSKVALIGGSAGGHLAMMVGYAGNEIGDNECPANSACKVQALVNLYGPTDLTTEFAHTNPAVEKFLGVTWDENRELFLTASPRNYISADDPPTLIFHGTLDEVVPPTQSDSLKVWLDRTGVRAEYHKLEGWPHTMDLSIKVNEYCKYYMRKFFEKYLPFDSR